MKKTITPRILRNLILAVFILWGGSAWAVPFDVVLDFRAFEGMNAIDYTDAGNVHADPAHHSVNDRFAGDAFNDHRPETSPQLLHEETVRLNIGAGLPELFLTITAFDEDDHLTTSVDEGKILAHEEYGLGVDGSPSGFDVGGSGTKTEKLVFSFNMPLFVVNTFLTNYETSTPERMDYIFENGPAGYASSGDNPVIFNTASPDDGIALAAGDTLTMLSTDFFTAYSVATLRIRGEADIIVPVPEHGSSVVLLGLALIAGGWLRRRLG